jgi:uncharacterized protein
VNRSLLAFLLLLTFSIQAAEVLPPVPKQYFNDYAHVVSSTTVDQLNAKLEQFERDSSDQILVAIYPKMQSDSSIEDYTVRVAQSWKVGQKGRDNGAVLFVFVQDRKLYIQVGYGLEGALPDALAKRIIETEIKPRFRNGDYAGGLTAGVDAILAAVRGESKGTGTTVAEHNQSGAGPAVVLLVIVAIFLLFFLAAMRRASKGAGYRRGYGGGWIIGGGGWSGGGWSSGSGVGGGGGGFSSGGFSSGGGSFGGGGAGGSW